MPRPAPRVAPATTAIRPLRGFNIAQLCTKNRPEHMGFARSSMAEGYARRPPSIVALRARAAFALAVRSTSASRFLWVIPTARSHCSCSMRWSIGCGQNFGSTPLATNDLVVACEPIQEREVDWIPRQRQLSIAQAPPARHPRPASGFLREHLPGNTAPHDAGSSVAAIPANAMSPTRDEVSGFVIRRLR
jgi:hypothetical protein